jgi:hypothetical protein
MMLLPLIMGVVEGVAVAAAAGGGSCSFHVFSAMSVRYLSA